jgi:hypothetical protein
MILYFIELKRDQWILKHFETDKRKLCLDMDDFTLQYRYLFEKLKNYNVIYYVSYKMIIIIYISNTILSSFLVYIYFYDITTLTFLIGNILLCSQKVYYGMRVSYNSYVKNLPMCYFLKNFISFNTIKSNKCHTKKSVDIGPFTSVKKISKILNPEIRSPYYNEYSLERIIEKIDV